MSLLRSLLVGAALAGGLAGSTPALAGSARSLVVSSPMLPWLYEYEGCELSHQHEGADAAIAACAPLRKKIEAQSGPVLPLWHPINTSAARRWLTLALDSADLQVREVSDRRWVPQPVVRYIVCVGDRLANSPQFIGGIAIDYTSADKACYPTPVPAKTPGLTEAERSRAYSYFREVRVNGRYIPSLPQTHPTSTFRLDGGLIGPVALTTPDAASANPN